LFRLADESIADPLYGHYPFTAIRRGSEELAQRCDLDREVAFLDRSARPSHIHEFGLGDDLTARLQQRPKEKHTSPSDGYETATTEKSSVIEIKDKGPEGEALPDHERSIGVSEVFGGFRRSFKTHRTLSDESLQQFIGRDTALFAKAHSASDWSSFRETEHGYSVSRRRAAGAPGHPAQP
jgi:hypothetical protein